MDYIASISYGKDSLAMLEAIRILNLPLTRIISVQEWATPELRSVLPEVAAFEPKADEFIFARYGLAVDHVRSPHTFEDLFLAPMSRHSARAGQIRGWPFQRGCWANSFLKIEPFRKACRKDDVTYLGIAANESARLRHSSRGNVSLPLVLAGWTEDDCFSWCKDNGILSPVYSSFARDGCWFCANSPVERLRWLRSSHPELWRKMLEWDKQSPVKFKAHYSILQLEQRFMAEDMGLVPDDNSFRWKMLEELPQLVGTSPGLKNDFSLNLG